MKARLMGTADETNRFVAELRARFDVVEMSKPYPCRGDIQVVRVYVEVRV